MTHAEIKRAFLASYEADGGINHLDGINLPAEESVNQLSRDFMHLLFPGFFYERSVESVVIKNVGKKISDDLYEVSGLRKKDVPEMVDVLLAKIETRLAVELEKCLRFNRDADPGSRARELTTFILAKLPDLRRVLQTDVAAAYEGDPAARSVEEIILSYPCVLVISLQRIAHVMYRIGIPLLPRMLTEYAHERTGADIHPGAEIGTHFFIDHCTGVVVGETARIGNHVKIYQGVTLGARSFMIDDKGHPVKGVKRHPELKDNVVVYPGATILGGDTIIGENSIVGSNVWLMQTMPPNSIAYYQGDSASIIRPRKTKEALIEELVDWVI